MSEINWVCYDCGTKASRLTYLKKYGKEPEKLCFDVSCYHEDICDVCGEKKPVTSVRDYYFPDFSLLETITNAQSDEWTKIETPKDTLESPIWDREPTTIFVPKMKWEVSLFGIDTFKHQVVKPPCLFWRIMQRLIIGNKWRKL